MALPNHWKLSCRERTGRRIQAVSDAHTKPKRSPSSGSPSSFSTFYEKIFPEVPEREFCSARNKITVHRDLLFVRVMLAADALYVAADLLPRAAANFEQQFGGGLLELNPVSKLLRRGYRLPLASRRRVPCLPAPCFPSPCSLPAPSNLSHPSRAAFPFPC